MRYRSALAGMNVTATLTPTIMIGDVAYVYFVLFAYMCYVMCGMAYYANKETDIEIPKARAHYVKTKEKMLLVIIITTICLLIVAGVHLYFDQINMFLFVLFEFITAIIQYTVMNLICTSTIKSEITRRRNASDGMKGNLKEDEEIIDESGETAGN